MKTLLSGSSRADLIAFLGELVGLFLSFTENYVQ